MNHQSMSFEIYKTCDISPNGDFVKLPEPERIVMDIEGNYEYQIPRTFESENYTCFYWQTNQWTEGACDFVKSDSSYYYCQCDKLGVVTVQGSDWDPNAVDITDKDGITSVGGSSP